MMVLYVTFSIVTYNIQCPLGFLRVVINKKEMSMQNRVTFDEPESSYCDVFAELLHHLLQSSFFEEHECSENNIHR